MPVCTLFPSLPDGRRPGRALSWTLALITVLSVGACASNGSGRARLTDDELAMLKPQIANHLRCVADAVDHGLPGTQNAIALVDDATRDCRQNLGPLADRLKGFSLTPQAHQRYLQAVVTASRDAVLRSMATRQASARSQ